MDEMAHRVTPQGGNELTLVKRGIGRGGTTDTKDHKGQESETVRKGEQTN